MNKVDEIMALVQQLGTSEHNQDDGQALYFENEIRKAIEAIAQPAGEAEPVYQVKQAIGASVWADASKDEFIEAVRHDLKRRILYTTPQQSQPLTDEQIEFLKFMDLLRVHHKTIEAWMLEQAGVEFTPLEQRKLAVAK